MVKEAVQSLSKGKSDGKRFQNDHLIYAPMICYVLLSFLLVHGYLPDDMLGSTIVTIPKNVKFNICQSENYRGVSLCSPVSKLYEYVVLNTYSSNMTTSDYQFAFKAKHSTVMCASILKEIVSYYLKRRIQCTLV